jgi:hypothetical protein
MVSIRQIGFLTSIFRAYEVAGWGTGQGLDSSVGRAWLPGCRAGWAGFHGPGCFPFLSWWLFRLVSRTEWPAAGQSRR